MVLRLDTSSIEELKTALAIQMIAGNKTEDKITFKVTGDSLGLYNQQSDVYCSYIINDLANQDFKEGEVKYFSFINIDEFLYAINNSNDTQLDFKLNKNSMRVEINGLTLSFSLITYDEEIDDLSLTESTTIDNYKNNLKKMFLDLNNIVLKKHLDAISPLLNTNYSNSGIYLTRDKLLYNDPTFVYTTKDITLPILEEDDIAYLNSEVLKLFTSIGSKADIVKKSGQLLIKFSDDFNYVGLSSGSLFVQFLNSKLAIENPADSDIVGINPLMQEDPSTIKFNRKMMLKSLKFLSGFCSGSDWKAMNFKAEGDSGLVINITKDSVFDAKETLQSINKLKEDVVDFNLLLDTFNVILSSFDTHEEDVYLTRKEGVVGIALSGGTQGNTEIIFAGVS